MGYHAFMKPLTTKWLFSLWSYLTTVQSHLYFQCTTVLTTHISASLHNRTCHPGGHHRNFYPDTLPFSQVDATFLKIEHLQIPSTGARSSNELRRLDYMAGYQDSSPTNGHQATCPIHCLFLLTTLDTGVIQGTTLGHVLTWIRAWLLYLHVDWSWVAIWGHTQGDRVNDLWILE